MENVEDIELCKILDVDVKQKVMYSLIRNRVPYAERWDDVPLLKRVKMHGAKEVCVILTHPERRADALKILHTLDEDIQQQIIID